MRFLAFFLFLPLLLSVAPAAHAALLNLSTGTRELEGVKLTEKATAKVADRAYELKAVGAGLRFKKVVLVKARVYVGELLLDAPEKFQRGADKALDSLAQEKAVAIRMTFLRDVDGATVQKSFREGLEANAAPLSDAAIQGFLEAVKTGGQAKEGKAIVVLGEKLAGGKEAISYENVDGKVTTLIGGPGLVKAVFSIWLGKVDDSGLENLRKGLLGGN
jgi:hypothetical protein